MWHNAFILRRIVHIVWWINLALFVLGVWHILIVHPHYAIRDMVISGDLHHINQKQIDWVVARSVAGKTLFTADLSEIQDRFSKLPWVRRTSIQRHWPNRLYVIVEEHSAFARWGNIGLVNTYGEPFYAATNQALPVFYGKGSVVAEMTLQYKALHSLLAPVGMDIAHLSLTSRHSWHVQTQRGMFIELGRQEVRRRLEKFIAAYLTIPAEVRDEWQAVDLRYANGFAIRRNLIH